MADVKCLICEELFPRGIKFHLKKCHGVEVKYEDDQITNHVCKVNSAVDFCKLHCMSYCYVNRFSGISSIRNQGFKSVVVSQRI